MIDLITQTTSSGGGGGVVQLADGTTNTQLAKVSAAGLVSVDASSTTVTVLNAAGTSVIGSVGTTTTPNVNQIVDGTTSTQKLAISASGAAKVDNSGVTQPISASSLPLPSGAATAAKQPALGTAGSASTDVITVQGIASGVAQPISGTVTVIGIRPFEAVLTITRPANTTAYAVGQVLSTATSALTGFPTFALGIGNNQRAIVNNVLIVSNNGAASTKGQFSVFLFNVNNPSGGGFNDASTFAPTAAALTASGNGLFGTIPSSIAQAGTAAYGYGLTNDTRQILTDGSGNTFLAVVLNNAYTPASGETITVRISGVY